MLPTGPRSSIRSPGRASPYRTVTPMPTARSDSARRRTATTGSWCLKPSTSLDAILFPHERKQWMKETRFDPPGLVDDLSGDDPLLQQWSDHVSRDFDIVVASIKSFLQKHKHGTPQLYNPLTQGLTDPDTILPIPWNGFPKRFTSPGQDSDYASAEPPTQPIGQPREQDEHLEWFAVRQQEGKIVKAQF